MFPPTPHSSSSTYLSRCSLPLRFFIRFDRFFVWSFYRATLACSPSAQNQHERDRRYDGQGTKSQRPSVSGSYVLLGLLAPK